MAKFSLPSIDAYRERHRYRRRVPADVRDKIGRAAWYRTFPTRTPLAMIERTARTLASKHDREIAAARGQEVSPAQIAEAESQAQAWLTNDKAEIHEMLSFFHGSGPDGLSAEDRAFVNAVEHDGRYVPASLSLTTALERDTRLYGQDRDPKPIQYAALSD